MRHSLKTLPVLNRTGKPPSLHDEEMRHRTETLARYAEEMQQDIASGVYVPWVAHPVNRDGSNDVAHLNVLRVRAKLKKEREKRERVAARQLASATQGTKSNMVCKKRKGRHTGKTPSQGTKRVAIHQCIVAAGVHGASPTEITAMTGITRHTLCSSLNRLAELGLVKTTGEKRSGGLVRFAVAEGGTQPLVGK